MELNVKAIKTASRDLAKLNESRKTDILCAMADALTGNADRILTSNEIDCACARSKKISGAILDRLRLTNTRLEDMAQGLRDIAALPGIIGEALEMNTRPNGLIIGKIRVPLGVVGIIYEARPNVTSDAVGLCIKTGNAVVLRGGSEAINSNKAIADVLSAAGEKRGLPKNAITFIDDVSRELVKALMKRNDLLDVLIPRGGAGLINSVVENSTVPVIETGVGICHTYVEKTADLGMAERIIINAKTSRPSVCNAMETLLVDEDAASEFLPKIAKALIRHNVELRGCKKTRAIIKCAPVADEDWSTEYMDLILSIKVVESFDEAIEHINTYSSSHSDCVVTNDYMLSQRFLREIDSACVYVNASTRFSDGFEFGKGAEIGISTQKLHARGPMGCEALTSTKYIIYGSGQTRG